MVTAAECAAGNRKERRKASKIEKRKKKRKEMAEIARQEEEARLNDPQEQQRLQAEEEQEKLRAEEGMRRFEETERKILEEWEMKKALEEKEEDERRRRAEEEELLSKQNQGGHENEVDDDDWEYVEVGPPEIIWQGNEIILKKKKIRVKKEDTGRQISKEDPNRPTSNPLPPQSEAFADHKNTSNLSAQQLLETVAQETPNFGTEQDKAHCPFHLKTGACRFGSRCSRIHFYPDKSCTLLIKNMYNGPGLAWEHDEGLEYTDEEVERAYEEFYEDVHTEFLKFGEIVNFKVCRNASSHLRGNVYVHYKSLDSAVLAYESVNGRYFAGKQVQCEFVGVTRWKVAICGEFMKSKLKNCSRGTTCNFIHCFRNPGGDYEWADWDKPPPKYWVKEMAALFGYPDESKHDERTEQGSPRSLRYSSARSQSEFSRNYCDDDLRGSQPRRHHRSYNRELDYEERNDISKFKEKQQRGNGSIDHDSDKDGLRKSRLASRGGSSEDEDGPDENMHDNDTDTYRHDRSRRSRRHKEKHGLKQQSRSASIDHDSEKDGLRKRKLASQGGSSEEETGPDENLHDTDTETYHHERSRRSRRHMEKHGSKGNEQIERQRERSPRSDVSDHKRINSSLWDHSDRGSGEVELGDRDSRRSYRSSKHNRRKDRSREEERGVRDETKPHNRIDERDRWAPDEGD